MYSHEYVVYYILYRINTNTEIKNKNIEIQNLVKRNEDLTTKIKEQKSKIGNLYTRIKKTKIVDKMIYY